MSFSSIGLAHSGSSDSSSRLEDTSVDEELTDQDRRRLELYHKSFDDQRVDINLIISLLTHIYQTEVDGWSFFNKSL